MASKEGEKHESILTTQPLKINSWCHTDFEEYEFSHRWTISNYSDRTKYNGYRIELQSPSFSPKGKTDQWALKLIPEQPAGSPLKNYAGIYVCLVDVANTSEKMWMRYKISISSSVSDVSRETTSYGKISKGQQVGVNNLIEKATLFDLEKGFLVDDTLTVYCTVFVKLLDTPQHSTGTIPPVAIQDFSLTAQLEDARSKGLYTDVVLVAGNKEFKAHRVVLALQSSFFNTRFQERWDQGDSRVQMTDIDPATLEAILSYVYTGKCEAVSSNTEKLLSAAEEYGLDRLRLACEKQLAQDVTTENVISMLLLADTHRAQHLKVTCLDFMVAHSSCLLASEGWEELKKSKLHEDVRMEVLEELLKRKH